MKHDWLPTVWVMFFFCTIAVPAMGEEPLNKSLELNWNILTGTGQYSTPTQKVDAASSGFMVELEQRNALASAPALYFSLAPAFYLLAGRHDFNVPISTPLAYTQEWSLTTSVIGSSMMAKYGCAFKFGPMELDFQNGFGVGYFVERSEWSWKDPANPPNQASGSSRKDTFEPMVDLNSTIKIALGSVSSLGFNLGVVITAFEAGGYTNPVLTKIGLNYQVHY